MKTSGKCIIFSAPSGSGKTTLVKDLIDRSELNLKFSISATTRKKRHNEVEGKDYFFISKPEFHTQPVDALIGMFADAGASVISFHPDASIHVDRSLQLIRDAGCQAGLVFNPAAGLEPLRYVMDKVDLVLLMSVNPGFGGQSFIPSTLPKLREARALIDAAGLPIRLEVDGGVSAANIREIAEAGADTFVAGSAIFNQPDYQGVIDKMRQELEVAAVA